MQEERPKIAKNAPCPCGSGKKYKMCCGAKAIAAEREAEAKSSPFWTPDGVTSERDDTLTGWPNGRPKWKLKLDVSDDNAHEDDADKVIANLVRPYFDRYCRMTDFEDDSKFEIAVMEAFAVGGNPIASCPSVTLGRYDQLWDMLRDRIAALFDDCYESEILCEVRWDHMFGGPIASFKAGRSVATFLVSKPMRFGEDKDGVEA